MNTPSSPIQVCAQRLLAAETASPSASDTHGQAVVRVCETLRTSLTEFVGADGFTALLRRALFLAQVDVPLLKSAKVGTDGRLEGIEDSVTDAEGESEAAITITSNLLGLLATFIGESLTLRLMRQNFPETAERMIVKSEEF